MRRIDKIIIHCTATKAGKHYTVSDVDSWHRARGWQQIGYHYLIYLDGTIAAGRNEALVGAHCLGHNAHSIGICYVGGLDEHARPMDTRTARQKVAMRQLLGQLRKKYGAIGIHGHNEFSNKACPCFDVAKEYGAM